MFYINIFDLFNRPPEISDKQSLALFQNFDVRCSHARLRQTCCRLLCEQGVSLPPESMARGMD